MGERITHEGIIDHIENNTVFVRILSKSACSECHSKSICSISEMTEKLIEVKTSSSDYAAGQTVNVILDRSLGNKAVLLGYLLPFLVMIITLLISSSFLPELWAGLLSIAVLAPYYFLMFVLRNKLSKTFYFRIERI